MRIFSWNVNGMSQTWRYSPSGLRAVAQKLVGDPFFNTGNLKGPNAFGKVLKTFFEYHKADIVCLQVSPFFKLSNFPGNKMLQVGPVGRFDCTR
jgi:exonuclease III